MRVAVALIALGVLLSGCSSDGGKEPVASDSGDFEDLGVKPTDTKGVLLGVVVDDAIRPIAEAKVALQMPAGGQQEKVTDDQGRFAFGDLEPGTYFLQVSHLQYASAQTSAEVRAGEADPMVHRVQLIRVFEQDPFTEQIQFEGFLACSNGVGVGTTCVNDYTRLVPQCNGGCLKQYNLSKTAGNIREYVWGLGPGWQSVVFEVVWEKTNDVSEDLTLAVSYFNRTSTSHYYARASQASPIRLQMDVGTAADGQAEEPELVPPEGANELFTFFNAGSGSVAVNQKFTSIQTHFYYGVPPEGWSFAAGDELPF
jgi:hypothetical protein